MKKYYTLWKTTREIHRRFVDVHAFRSYYLTGFGDAVSTDMPYGTFDDGVRLSQLILSPACEALIMELN